VECFSLSDLLGLWDPEENVGLVAVVRASLPSRRAREFPIKVRSLFVFLHVLKAGEH